VINQQTVLINRMEKQIMSTQAEADAIAAELQQENSDLNAAVTGIQAEIDALKAAQPAIDLTALQDQADAVKAAVAAAAALVPAPAPAPTPAPPAA
jgi:peptidoglycan hydrolase CwlO-like protein